eukprot:GHRR01017115.1.p1 GENE.GHRR01017115.1~~GHRR01017115.1.p1  ORF type:complete len:241 (+),score=56.23 GHRR01017115.1:156-878(+)
MMQQSIAGNGLACRQHARSAGSPAMGPRRVQVVRPFQAASPAIATAPASSAACSPAVHDVQLQMPCVRSCNRRVVVRASSNTTAGAKQEYRSKPANQVTVLVVGPTGYIGRFVTKELIDRGYNVIALAREKAGIKGKMGKEDTIKEFPGAQVAFGDVTDLGSLRQTAFTQPVDVVVSCLASRTGGKKDSWLIDYQVTSVKPCSPAIGRGHCVLCAYWLEERHTSAADQLVQCRGFEPYLS